MTSKKTPPPPIDLEAVREATEALERIAREHPELVGPSSEANVDAWVETLRGFEDDVTTLKQIGIRWPDDLVDRLDAYVEKVLEERPGVRYSRSDAVRELVERGLAKEGFGPKASAAKRKIKR